MLSRRQFVLNSGVATVGACLALGACSMTSAETGIAGTGSYISGVVRPENSNVVTVWTDRMLQAVRDFSFNPPEATRAFAICHLAAFEAANAVSKQYRGILALPDVPSGIDPRLAYEAAFLTAMNATMNTTYRPSDYMSMLTASGEPTASLNWGRNVAAEVLGLRSSDGSRVAKDQRFAQHGQRNDNLGWEPTGPHFGAPAGVSIPVTNAPGLLPGWGLQQTWVMSSNGQFRANDFPEEGSAEFLRQMKKVRELGGMDSTIRTSDNSEVAFFWEDGPKGVTPPGHWQIIAMDVLQDRGVSFIDQARAMALISLGQADAAITTWDSKYHHDILRPETAIRKRARQFSNSQLHQYLDPSWTTLIPTPPFPAYTSGHSTFSAVSARMLANIIGTDRVSFSGTAPDLINWPSQLRGVRRSWSSLSQAADEGGMSREYGGIHWESDNTEGLRVGRDLADYVFANALKVS